MTNPALSVAAPEAVGRLYQLPGGQYGKTIQTATALQGVEAGELFPSITNILKVEGTDFSGWAIYMMLKGLREGMDWSEAAKYYIDYRDMTSERGSHLHLMYETYIDEGKARFPYFPYTSKEPLMRELITRWGEEAKGYFTAFLSFCKQYKPEFLDQEATVYGNTIDNADGFNFAGTTDFTAIINGVKVVGDWKNTSKLYGSVASQLAAARYATHSASSSGELVEWDGESIQTAIAVRLMPSGEFEVKQANLQEGWERFKYLRQGWEAKAFGVEHMLEDFIPDEPII